MRQAFLAALFALPVCGSTTGSETMMGKPTACEVTGVKYTALETEEICRLFLDAVHDAGRHDVVAIEVAALSPTSARVVATDSEDEKLAELDFDIMDRELGPAAWRDFATALGRHLSGTS